MINKNLVQEIPVVSRGKILIMDDEIIVRALTGKMLQRLGFKVDYAQDGTEAIEVYKVAKESGQPFEAVIMDLHVPHGMGGEEAIKKLREIDPQVKAIVSSADFENPILADFRAYGFCGVLAKPYNIMELYNTINKVLLGVST